LQELKKNEITSKTEGLSGKSVTVFISSTFVFLSGNWYWDLYADAVFCSDVMLSMPVEFTGTKGIVHPDDLLGLKEHLNVYGEIIKDLQFRIITTYGEIKTLIGQNISVEENKEGFEKLQENLMQIVTDAKEYENFQLLKEVYGIAEKDTQTGVWFYNSVTNKTWYSDYVFRLYDLLPQSLNAHLHTFNSFIHPDERDIVTEFVEKAYKQRTPLHLEYRIHTPVKEKFILYKSHWFFTIKGEAVLAGTLSDITEQKLAEQKLETAQSAAAFHKQIMQMDEQGGNMGHWQVSLLTRKSFYSDNVFRIYGVKPGAIPASIDAFINYVYPDDRELVVTAARQMMEEHKVPELEFRIIRADGKIRYISQKSKLVVSGGEMVMAGSVQDVTAQKTLEKKMRGLTEEVSVKTLVQQQAEESAGTACWILNIANGKIKWSDNFYKLFGFKPGATEMTEKQFILFVHPDDQKKLTHELAIAQKQLRDSEFEFRMLHRGHIKYMKASLRILPNGEEHLLIGTLQDVTDKKILEEQLHQQVQLAESLAGSVLDRVIITDVNHNIVLWNSQCEAFYKTKVDDAIGKNFFDVFPKLKSEQELALFDRVLKGETVHVTALQSVTGNGYYDLHLLPLWCEEKTNVTGIIHIVHDVTKELELRKNINERLRFIEGLVEASVDKIIVMDRNMNYLIWNKRCEEYYGLKKEQVIGKNILEVFPGSFNEPAYADFKKALKGETVYIPADEETPEAHHHEVYLVPVKNETGEVIAVLWILHDLTKEMQLLRQKQKADVLLNTINEVCFELDEDFNFIYANRKAFDFWDKSPEDILGKNILEVFPEIVDTTIYHALQKALLTKTKILQEAFHPVTKKWVFINVHPSSSGLIVLYFDISKQVQARKKAMQAEEKIRETKDLLEQTTHATPDAIIIFNWQQEQMVLLNSCLSDWTGYTNEELMNMSMNEWLKFIHQDDREKLNYLIENMGSVPDGKTETLEYRLLTRNGKTLWIKSRSKVFKRNTEGEVTHVLTVLQDFTEEVELRHQLIDRSMFIETLIDNNIDRVMVLDREYKIISWNKRCEEIYHLKKEQIIGQSIVKLFPRLKEDGKLLHAVEQAMQGLMVHIPVLEEIYNQIYSEFFSIPLKNEEGEVYAVLILLHDVSKMLQTQNELEELNKTLEQKNKELEEKNEEITSFAFIASHDLKEPLRKLYTFSDWLLEREAGSLSETGRNYLKKIANSVRRMDMLIEDVLVLTKIDCDRKPLSKIDLNAILSRVLGDMKEYIKENGAEILAEELPLIEGHDNQVFYLFKNLLDNAVKFQPPGNQPLVKITAEQVELHQIDDKKAEANIDYYKISFEDNGLGLDSKYFKKIFQVFQRLHNKSEFEGTGMGLAICRKIMQNHGGIIKVESEPGKGAVFSCYFPII
jgi:PAS domain S-box-containing protein